MRYYPVNLDIRGKKCLVVGGGSVGTRKVKTLKECGAHVTVISPEVTKELVNMSETGKIKLHRRRYQTEDLKHAFLVIGATDDEKLNAQISRDANAANTLCNIADRPRSCNFILPSIVKRGDLVIAVSTSGQSPAFAKKLRKDLEKLFGEEFDKFLKLMGAIRKKLLAETHEHEFHKPIFEKLINSKILENIKSKNIDSVDKILEDILGKGYRYELLVDEKEKET